MGDNGNRPNPEASLALFKATLSKLSNLDYVMRKTGSLKTNRDFKGKGIVFATIPETALVLKLQEIRQMGQGDG